MVKLENINANANILDVHGIRVLFSYAVPVAAIDTARNTAVKHKDSFSRTTSAHVNKFLRDSGFDPKKVHQAPGAFFNVLLDSNNIEAHRLGYGADRGTG